MAEKKDSPPPVKLAKMDGKEVLAVSLAIRNTGDGLSDAMMIDPVELHHGDNVDILVRGRVIDVQSPEIKDTNGVNRKHIVRAFEGIIVSSDIAEPMLADQRARVKKRREEEAGIDQFPDTEGGISVGSVQKAAAELDGKSTPPKAATAAKKVADAKGDAKSKLTSVQDGKAEPSKAAAKKA